MKQIVEDYTEKNTINIRDKIREKEELKLTGSIKNNI